MRWSLLVLAFAAVACGNKDGGGDKPAPGSAGSAAAPTAPPRKAPADAAYVVLEKKGLVAIEDGAFRTIVEDKYVGGRAMARKDGGLWAYVDDRVARYDGELAPVPGAPAKLGPLAVGPDGTLWVSGEGLASYDGKAWKTHDLPAAQKRANVHTLVLGPDGARHAIAGTTLIAGRGDAWSTVTAADQKISSLAMAGDGTIHVATRDQLSRLVDGKLVPLAPGKKLESPKLLTAPDGTVHVFGLGGGYRLAGDKLEPLAKLPFTTGQTFGADGTLYGIPLGGMRIVRRRPDGAVDRIPADRDLPFQAKAIDVDARNRLWLVLEYGMALVDGDQLTVLTPGTVPELSRNVEAIVVTGKGPDLPDVGPPKLINLKGTMVSKGKPKPGVKLEICPSLSGVFHGSSPCEGRGFVRRATSGADGGFTLSDVPLGGWHLVYRKSTDAWVFYFPPGCCGGLAKGGTFDMGEVEFGKSSK